MIIKVKSLKGNKNIFIDNIEEVKVNSVKDYVLAYAGIENDGFPYIKAFRFIENLDIDIKVKNIINRNSLYYYDKILFDEDIIISQLHCTDKVEDSKTKNSFWKFSELDIVKKEVDGTKLLKYIWLPSVQEVFLLNNSGKTIDRYYS